MQNQTAFSKIGNSIIYAAIAASAFAACQNIRNHQKMNMTEDFVSSPQEMRIQISQQCQNHRLTEPLLNAAFSTQQIATLHETLKQIATLEEVYIKQHQTEEVDQLVNIRQQTCQVLEGYIEELSI